MSIRWWLGLCKRLEANPVSVAAKILDIMGQQGRNTEGQHGRYDIGVMNLSATHGNRRDQVPERAVTPAVSSATLKWASK